MCGVFIFPELYKSISDGTLKARHIRGKKRDCTCLVVFPVPGKFEPTNLHVDNNGKRDTGKFSEASSPKWLVIPANTVVEKVTSDIPPGLYGNFFCTRTRQVGGRAVEVASTTAALQCHRAEKYLSTRGMLWLGEEGFGGTQICITRVASDEVLCVFPHPHHESDV